MAQMSKFGGLVVDPHLKAIHLGVPVPFLTSGSVRPISHHVSHKLTSNNVYYIYICV